jgi:hypothetical protein
METTLVDDSKSGFIKSIAPDGDVHEMFIALTLGLGDEGLV